MSVVFVAGVWFVLGVVVCFVSGRGSSERRVPILSTPPVLRQTIVLPRFVPQPAHTWTTDANRVALGQLHALTTEALDLAAPQA